MKSTKRFFAILLSMLMLVSVFAFAASAATDKTCKCENLHDMKLIVDYSCKKDLKKNYMVFYCEICDTYKTVDLEKAGEHEEEIIKGKDSTCTENGLSDGVKCKVCGDTIKEQTVTEKKPHVNNGEDYCANCGADMLENRCPYCNKDHGTSFGGRITRFFHDIAYNFQKMFNR